ncbi:hypothetical protein [Candidatus Chloroploca sp. Khr17]|uniref:hypothetical protein n=1 Tax=Candidatus Chloroploca sp. Khr17 TaxID=2496869 RepID=UPI00101C8939|nr:hypothetical protein [Candidatus Chloroploca sp. Khr17]
MVANPYSNEVRYSLGLMLHHLDAARPRRVRLATHCVEMARSAARFLCHSQLTLEVESATIRDALGEIPKVAAEVRDPQRSPADAALFPFSLEEGLRPAGEPLLVAASYNGLSYKRLLYPRQRRPGIFATMAALRPAYCTQPLAGLYSPRFILGLALAKMLEGRDSARYFAQEDRTMRRLIDTGPLWRFSYIVIFTGHRTA